MVRGAKYGALILGVMVLGGFLIFGSRFPSYVKSSAHAMQETVQDQVPVEFELRRARDMIENILPELQGQVRRIAEEEVAIHRLEQEIDASGQRLVSEKKTLASLRNKMRVHQVAYRIDDRDVSRQQLTEQLARRFDRFKQGELTLASKQQLLANRQKNLSAAMTALETMRHRKAELEQKVEMLAAQAQNLKTQQIQSGVPIDGSELSEADQLLSDIETRLNVASRVLDFQQETEVQDWSDDLVDEHQVLLEMDEYFDDNEDSGRTMVVAVDELN